MASKVYPHWVIRCKCLRCSTPKSATREWSYVDGALIVGRNSRAKFGTLKEAREALRNTYTPSGYKFAVFRVTKRGSK